MESRSEHTHLENQDTKKWFCQKLCDRSGGYFGLDVGHQNKTFSFTTTTRCLKIKRERSQKSRYFSFAGVSKQPAKQSGRIAFAHRTIHASIVSQEICPK
jgi:hypothetical protein